jgi:hypothetical protein
MPQIVDVIGIGAVEFPDGMSKEEMAAALSKLPSPAKEQPMAPVAPPTAEELAAAQKPAFLSRKPMANPEKIEAARVEYEKKYTPFEDLYKNPDNFKKIFDYGTARFGKEGQPNPGESQEEYVKRFASHMRKLDLGSELDAFGEVQYLNNAKDEDKLKAGAAYDLFKKTAGYFSRTGQGGFAPVVDALGAILSSPTTALSLGAAKLVGSAIAKEAIKQGLKSTLKTAGLVATIPAIEGTGAAVSNVASQKIDLNVAQAQLNTAKKQLLTLPPEGQAELQAEVIDPLQKRVDEGVSGSQILTAGLLGVITGTPEVLPFLKIKKANALSDLINPIKPANTPSVPTVNVKATDPTQKALEDAFDIFDGRRLLDAQGAPTSVANMEVRNDINKRATLIAQDIWKQLPDTAPQAQEKVSDAIKRTLENVDVIDDVVFERALASADVTPEEFAKMFRTSIGDAARSMQSLSVVSRLQNKLRAIDPAASKELDKLYGNRNALTDAFSGLKDMSLRLDRELKALMVSQLSTTIRNAFSGAAVVTFGTASEAIESALYRMGKTAGELASGAPVTGSFTGGLRGVYDDAVRTVFYLGQQDLSSDVTEALLKGTPALYRRMIKTTGEAGPKDLSKVGQIANTFNVAQDAFFRTAIFTASVEKQLSRVGINMYDIIAKGKDVPFDVLRNAVDESLSATFSKMPTKGPMFHAVKFVEELGPIGSTVIPFPRFMANAMSWTFIHSPVGVFSGSADITAGLVKAAKGNELASTQMMQGLENFSKGSVGTAAIYAAYKYREQHQDNNWYDVKNPDGSLVDARALFPVAPFLAVGDYLVKFNKGRTDEFSTKEFLEAMLGFKAPAGTYSWLGDKFAEASANAQTGEGTADMKVKTFFGEWLGEYLGRALVPVQQLSDIIGAIDRNETLPRDAYQIPAGEEGVVSSATQQLKKRTPIIKQELPVYQPPLRETAVFNEAGPLKMLTGIALKGTPSDLEQEVTKLHVPPAKIFTSTGDKIVDAEARKIMAPLVVEQFNNLKDMDFYKNGSPDLQKIALQNLIGWAQKTGKEIAVDKDMAAAYQAGQQPRLFEVQYSRLAPELKRVVVDSYRQQQNKELAETKDYATALAIAEAMRDLPGYATGGDVTKPLGQASLYEMQMKKLTSKKLKVIKDNFQEEYGREYNPDTDYRLALNLSKGYGYTTEYYSEGGALVKKVLSETAQAGAKTGVDLMEKMGEIVTKYATTPAPAVEQTAKVLSTPAAVPFEGAATAMKKTPYIKNKYATTPAQEPTFVPIQQQMETSIPTEPTAVATKKNVAADAEQLKLDEELANEARTEANKAYEQKLNAVATAPDLNNTKFAFEYGDKSGIRKSTLSNIREIRTNAFNTLKDMPVIQDRNVSEEALAVAQGDYRNIKKREVDLNNPTDVAEFADFAGTYQKKLEMLREEYKDRPPVKLYHGATTERTPTKVKRGFFDPQLIEGKRHLELHVGASSFTKDLRLNYREFGGQEPKNVYYTSIPYADYEFRKVNMSVQDYVAKDMNTIASTITGSPDVARPLSLPRSLAFRETEDAFVEADKLKMQATPQDFKEIKKSYELFDKQERASASIYRKIIQINKEFSKLEKQGPPKTSPAAPVEGAATALKYMPYIKNKYATPVVEQTAKELSTLAVANNAYTQIKKLITNEFEYTGTAKTAKRGMIPTFESNQSLQLGLEELSKKLEFVDFIKTTANILKEGGSAEKAEVLTELANNFKTLKKNYYKNDTKNVVDQEIGIKARIEATNKIRDLVGGGLKVEETLPSGQKTMKRLAFSEGGLAPFGLRHTGDSAKGKGYFGELKHSSGKTSTELSSEFEYEGKTIEYPLIVPTLSIKELDHLLSGEKATNEIYDKAESWAKSRIKEGKSPFSQPDELRMPAPKMSRGGLASRR